MVTTAPRIRNLRLASTDTIFDGREARLMRRLLDMEPSDGNPPARPSSIAEQTLLAEKLDRRGRFPEALLSAGSLGLRDFGAAGLAVLYAPTLHDVERCLRHFAPLLNLRHSVALRRSDTGVALRIGDSDPRVDTGTRRLKMLDFAKLDRFFRDLLERQGIRQTEPRILSAGEAYAIPRQLCDPLPRKNLSQFRRHEKSARKLMKELEHAHLETTVRRILIAGAGTGDRLPELAEVARQLGYSPRTLRRRLTERGTSFLDCINEVRHQLALRYLASSNFTVDAIAERLGYSDTSNFRHAFRRWTGVSPKAYIARACADLPVAVMRAHRAGGTVARAPQVHVVSR